MLTFLFFRLLQESASGLSGRPWTEPIVLARQSKYMFRFIVEGSIEERMLKWATQKLRLDQQVIQQGQTQQAKSMFAEVFFKFSGSFISAATANKVELLEMITYGWKRSSIQTLKSMFYLFLPSS